MAWPDGELGRADLVAGLLVGGRGEDLGLRQGALPLRHLLRPLVGEQDADVRSGLRDRGAQRPQQGGSPGAGLREHQHPLAEGQGPEQVHGADQRIAGRVRREQPPVGRRRR